MTTLAFSTDAEKRDAGWALAQERGQLIAEMVAALTGLLATNTDLQHHSGHKDGCATCRAVLNARGAISRATKP